MQEGDQIGLGLVQPGPEQIGKQVVIAEPGALIIQRDAEKGLPVPGTPG